jgi:hypothetical protein
MCVNASDDNIIRFYNHMAAYQSLSNYLILAIPNLLSYSFVFNKWMEQIDLLKAENDKVGLVYIYSVIARKLIFFDIVNVTDTLEPLPTDFDRLLR